MPNYPSPVAGTAGAYRSPGSNQAAGYQPPYPPAYAGSTAGQPSQPGPGVTGQMPYPPAAAYPQGFAPYPQPTPQTCPQQQTGKSTTQLRVCFTFLCHLVYLECTSVKLCVCLLTYDTAKVTISDPYFQVACLAVCCIWLLCICRTDMNSSCVMLQGRCTVSWFAAICLSVSLFLRLSLVCLYVHPFIWVWRLSVCLYVRVS